MYFVGIQKYKTTMQSPLQSTDLQRSEVVQFKRTSNSRIPEYWFIGSCDIIKNGIFLASNVEGHTLIYGFWADFRSHSREILKHDECKVYFFRKQQTSAG